MKYLAATAIAALTTFGTCTARADIVTDWNQTALEVMKVARVAGNPWSRTLAMLHVAMSDAINTVQGRYTRCVATVAAAPSASAEAAGAAAARQICSSSIRARKRSSTKHTRCQSRPFQMVRRGTKA